MSTDAQSRGSGLGIGSGHWIGVRLIPIAVIAVLLGPFVAFEIWAAALGWRTHPRRTAWPRWFNRVWWWAGYRGLYQLDWWMKGRA